MEWYIKVLKDYANFEGRASCREYWMFVLINTAIAMFFLMFFIVFEFLLDTTLENHTIKQITESTVLCTVFSILVLYILCIIIPILAVSVRRLHDIGKSGWFILISFIPIVGTIILLVWVCQEGMPEANEYGENPKLLE